MSLTLVALVLALVQLPQPGRPGVRSQPGTGLVVGQVVDASTGKPVSNAIVIMPGREPALLTGADGRFVFRDLPAGTFNISASKVGYSRGAYGRRRPGGPGRPLVLGDGERRGDLVVQLWKQAVVAGRVVDEAGEPAVGVRVTAFRRDGSAAADTQTDDRGAYRFGLLDGGEYLIGIIPSVRSSFSVTIDSTGRVVPTRSVEEPQPLLVYPETFYPAARDLSSATVITVAAGQEREDVDLQLSPVPAVRVSGTVHGAPDSARIAIELLPASRLKIPLRGEIPSTMADPSGYFTFPSVAPDEYVLRATQGNRFQGYSSTEGVQLQFAQMRITVGQAPLDGLSLALKPGLRISGRLEFEGRTQRPARLTAVGINVEPALAGAFLGPSRNSVRAYDTGAFETVPMEPGRYYVRVTDSPPGWMFKSATVNGRDVVDTPLDLTDEDVTDVVVTFSDRWSGLGGSVLTAAGEPDPDAVVIAFPTDPQTWSSSGINPRRLRSTAATDTGQYTFATLPPGDYFVAAVRDEHAAGWRDPAFLEVLSRTARRVTIRDGQRPTQDLRTQAVR